MKLLLDTHTVIWWGRGDRQLSVRARQAILDPSTVLIVSAVVIWEISIKVSLRRLNLGKPTDVFLNEMFLQADVEQLYIRPEHALGVEKLPFHHNDPFDRLLIAQAISENATLLTRDPLISAYGVPVLWEPSFSRFDFDQQHLLLAKFPVDTYDCPYCVLAILPRDFCRAF